MSGSFTLDPDELDAVIADLVRTENALETLADDVRRQVDALHATWEGLAARAQREAQREWEAGVHEMRAALVGLRAAAQTARSNYLGAAEANATMWADLA